MKTINGIPILAKKVCFDGCHKFYLVYEETDGFGAQDPMCRQFEEWGYTIYPIEKLPELWEGSCPLRFISTGDLTVSIVDQFQDAVFEGWGEPVPTIAAQTAPALLGRAWNAYRLDWMAKHGFTLEDVIERVRTRLAGDGNADPDLLDAFIEWEEEEGFGGEIWACEGEFAENEFADGEYMKSLLEPDDFEEWKSLRQIP